MSFCGKVNTTEIGWICVIVTIGVLVPGCTMLPMSTWRMPVTPSIGGHDARVAELGLRVEYRCLVGSDARLQLADLRRLVGHLLCRCETLLQQRREAIEIDLRIGQLGFIAREVRFGLLQGRLKWPRVELGDQIALVHRLSFDESDRAGSCR